VDWIHLAQECTVADSFENDNELSVSITKLKKDYDGEGNEKTGCTRQENIKQYIRTNGRTCNM
jgi:hypothetical protein